MSLKYFLVSEDVGKWRVRGGVGAWRWSGWGRVDAGGRGVRMAGAGRSVCIIYCE